MDYLLETDNGHVSWTFNSVNDIRNNIILSLIVKKGSFFLNPEFGSQLHELKNNSPESCNLAAAYCTDAVKWVKKIGRISQFDVSASPFRNGISLKCIATLPDKTTISYEHFVRVA